MAFSSNNIIFSFSNPLKKTLISSSPSLPSINPTQFINSANITGRRFAISASASSNTTTTPAPATAAASNWSKFAKKVSGEWDGFGADFTSDGEPIELPESVVPEAYREWEVKVFDWQTQCPTLAGSEESDPMILRYKSVKLLPTVGCEADAATRHSVEERITGGPANGASAFAYESGGRYVAVWAMDGHGKSGRLMELEHCLIHPQDHQSRVRIIQVVRVENTDELILHKIKVFREQWYGPFINGEQLGGCAIRDSAFASTDTLISSKILDRVWRGPKAIANFENSHQDNKNNNIKIQELLMIDEENVREIVRHSNNMVFLPKQLWCSMKNGDGETWFEVGWLVDDEEGLAITSQCIFSKNGQLKEIMVGCENGSLGQ